MNLRNAVRASLCVALACSPWAGFFVPPPADAAIMFPGGTAVPPAVQDFAWRVIQTRCNYLPYELDQRSFWAWKASATKVAAGDVYAIDVVSDLVWKKTEPPAVITMTIVDDGRLRLTDLASSFVVCTR